MFALLIPTLPTIPLDTAEVPQSVFDFPQLVLMPDREQNSEGAFFFFALASLHCGLVKQTDTSTESPNLQVIKLCVQLKHHNANSFYKIVGTASNTA